MPDIIPGIHEVIFLYIEKIEVIKMKLCYRGTQKIVLPAVGDLI